MQLTCCVRLSLARQWQLNYPFTYQWRALEWVAEVPCEETCPLLCRVDSATVLNGRRLKESVELGSGLVVGETFKAYMKSVVNTQAGKENAQTYLGSASDR